MDYFAIDRLLDPAPMPLETGFERLANGVLHIAARTDMHGCRGDMIEWWFRFRPDSRQYRWWHPIDHVSSRWHVERKDSHIGSTHFVEESCVSLPVAPLTIQFRDPSEFFAEEVYDAARSSGAISAAVCGHVGFSHAPQRDDRGRVCGGRLMHIGRDTPWGCALRQHFYLGVDMVAEGASPAAVESVFGDEFGTNILMHTYEEFLMLSRFLPSLYAAENHDRQPVARPW